MSYTGVYSEIGAGTSVGTELERLDTGKLGVKSTKATGRQYVTTKTLEESELNVAKIRLVSTLPGKSIDEEVRGKAYIGFILTAVQESHDEKVEIVPLPGDSFASYFYGANPRQFSFTGILLNTDQDQWRDSFEQIYEKHLRGSVSSRNFSIVQVSYNGRIVSGWLTNMSQQLDSSNDHYAQFNFSVLVSRIDMVGGSKRFTDYLVKLGDAGGEFAEANLDASYAILDPTNYNAMIDPIRTGMVIPPKRPHRARAKRKASPDCYWPVSKTVSGQTVNNGAATANDHINDATVCSVIEAIEGTNAKIAEATKEANRLYSTKNGRVPTQADIDKADALIAKAANYRSEIDRRMATEEVKQQLADESRRTLELVREAAKETKGGKPTARAIRAQERLNNPAGVPVGSARIVEQTIAIGTVEQDGTLDVEESRTARTRFDPTVYTGTESSAEANKAAREQYYSSNSDEMGIAERARAAREKEDAREKEKRKRQQDNNNANRLLKRAGI
jgi:hypothetical protein